MSLSIQALHASLAEAVEQAIAPLIKELRGASAVLPAMVAAEHRRRAAIQGRLAEIDSEIEQILTRRNASARRLDAYQLPKPAEPSCSAVVLPIGKWGRP